MKFLSHLDTLNWDKFFDNHIKDWYSLPIKTKKVKIEEVVLINSAAVCVNVGDYQGNRPIILSEAFWQTKEVPFVLVTRCNLFATAKTKGISSDLPRWANHCLNSYPTFWIEFDNRFLKLYWGLFTITPFEAKMGMDQNG